MHRTDALNNVDGQFTDDYEGTLEGTVVEKDWLNAVQNELINVLTLAGIVPAKANHDQLANAIAILITASASAHSNLTNPHSATSGATANRLILRDAFGRAKVEPPSAADDIAIKQTIDTHAAVVSTEALKGHVELATTSEASTGTDTVRAVTPAGMTASTLGRGQTWQDVKASRAFGVTYTNSTGRPIEILVRATRAGVDTSSLNISINGGASFTFASGTNSNGGNTCAGSIIIPNGHTYSVTSADSVLAAWHELR